MSTTDGSRLEPERPAEMGAKDPFDTTKPPRPGWVTALAIIQVLSGVILIVSIAVASSRVPAESRGSGGLFATQMLVASLLYGVLGIAAGVGMWLGKRWGWWLAAFVYLYGILRAASAMLSIPAIVETFGEPSRGSSYYYLRQIFSAVRDLLFLAYWFSQGVRDYFGLENLSRLRAILALVGVCIVIIVAGNLLGAGAGGDLNRIAGLYQEGDLDTALEELEQYLESYPDDDMGWTLMGHMSQDVGEFEDAEAAYDRAIAINPERYEAWTGLGVLSRVLGDHERALECYENALEIEPADPDAHISLAVLALSQYQDAKALDHAETARALDRHSPVIAANLAVIYHYNGMYEERDEMTAEAEKLGYEDVDILHMIYEGLWEIRE